MCSSGRAHLGQYLDDRRAAATARLAALRSALSSAESRIAGKACVYVTGSFGRGEASAHSDLDLFIVGRSTEGEPRGEEKLGLSRLDQICVKADLIHVAREKGFPDFSGDGEYLEHYTVAELNRALGKPEDDATNTFTARLLLLLESTSLLGNDVRAEAIDNVIAKYWGDFEDHRDSFVPAFLTNDILRLWRTFCVNYEARTARDPAAQKAKRALKNYKLKHSRALTCYSAVAYMLAVFGSRQTVTPDDAKLMADLSPTARLEALRENFGADADIVEALLSKYELFLSNTDAAEADLVQRFMDREKKREYFNQANAFGDGICELIQAVGGNSRFHRLVVV